MKLSIKFDPKESAKNFAYITVGLFLSALSYRMFLIPNEVAPGGFTGIGQLLNALFGINVGTVSIILNVPLFAVSMRSLGLAFGVKSFAASMLLSLLIDYLPIPAATDDILLASVFGGVVGGAGFGLILRGSATTGGSDMLGTLIHSVFPPLKVGVVVFMIDAAVVLASAFVFSPILAMYALISTFIMNFTLEYVLEGPNKAIAFLIISTQSDAIAKQIMADMDRGVTGLNGTGKFSGESREVLLCVINRFETMQLRRIVVTKDPKAFMIAINAHEVLGEGFKNLLIGKK